jgi:hypothetical protein
MTLHHGYTRQPDDHEHFAGKLPAKPKDDCPF